MIIIDNFVYFEKIQNVQWMHLEQESVQKLYKPPTCRPKVLHFEKKLNMPGSGVGALYSPPPWTDRLTDRLNWKHYLPAKFVGGRWIYVDFPIAISGKEISLHHLFVAVNKYVIGYLGD